MLASIGHGAVVIGLAVSLFAAAASILAGRSADAGLAAAGRRAVYATWILSLVACAAMAVSLLNHDFSILYVARNNATTTPPFYSFISLWAALEGSILFWTFLLTGWSSLLLYRYRSVHAELMPWATATLALVAAFFFSVMTWPSDPFVSVTPVTTEGNGPNALLQNHPFMGLHPPLLYLGYTGLALPFALTVAALVTRRLDAGWLRVIRRWTLGPWIFLTAGIVAGAWWSYEVLGWGGYWAWDPVENAALLPWLTATAFIHSAIVAERGRSLRTWTAILVVTTFTLTLLGTFLTRSGVVESVHSFTQSAIGAWFLGGVLASLVFGSALILWRLPDLAGSGPPPALVSRESAFLLNNLLFSGLAFAVLFGTLYPLVVEALGGERLSVGAPWFDRVSAPFFAALLFLLGVGPALPWGSVSWPDLRDRFVVPAVAGAGLMVLGVVAGVRGPAPLVTLGLAGFSGALLIGEVVRAAAGRARSTGERPLRAAWGVATRNRRRYGGYLAHVGVLVAAIAVAVSATGAVEATAVLAPGESTRLAAYTVTHDRLVQEPLAADPRVFETRAELAVSGPQAAHVSPALRDYPNSVTPIATPSVLTSAAEDFYLTLLAYDPESGAITIRLFINPLVAWIWVGGAVVVLGAAFAIWPQRRLAAATVIAVDG
ncbi:MAG TPA: cytochrome c-type biogenesis CcmF C-terminal domain-containing protein [Actinomycetota bacterium]|nr:cytochrome c-type biogenesis CcmF C-terminal domain-containing protein [Actinomycetota bacterium]